MLVLLQRGGHGKRMTTLPPHLSGPSVLPYPCGHSRWRGELDQVPLTVLQEGVARTAWKVPTGEEGLLVFSSHRACLLLRASLLPTCFCCPWACPPAAPQMGHAPQPGAHCCDSGKPPQSPQISEFPFLESLKASIDTNPGLLHAVTGRRTRSKAPSLFV